MTLRASFAVGACVGIGRAGCWRDCPASAPSGSGRPGGGTVASVGRALTEPVVVLVNARVARPISFFPCVLVRVCFWVWRRRQACVSRPQGRGGQPGWQGCHYRAATRPVGAVGGAPQRGFPQGTLRRCIVGGGRVCCRGGEWGGASRRRGRGRLPIGAVVAGGCGGWRLVAGGGGWRGLLRNTPRACTPLASRCPRCLLGIDAALCGVWRLGSHWGRGCLSWLPCCGARRRGHVL